MLSCLVFGWDLVLCPVLRTPIDRSRRAQRLPLPRLGISPQSPSGSQLWAVTPGLLRPLVPVQMTPGRHPDGVLSSCLASPGVWECPWIPSVPGGARVALSLRSPSRWTCHQASLQVHSPPTSHAHTPRPPSAWLLGGNCGTVHHVLGASILQLQFWRKMETQLFQDLSSVMLIGKYSESTL